MTNILYHVCALLGQETTMYVSCGSPWCIYFRCASQRCRYCAGCVPGGVWLTGGYWSVKSRDVELSLFNSSLSSELKDDMLSLGLKK